MAFFEAALRQLRKAESARSSARIGGCAINTARNCAKLMTSAFAVDVVIEMHNADAFHDEVDAYPAITVIRRQKQGTAVVASAGRKSKALSSANALSATLQDEPRAANIRCPTACVLRSVDTWFKGADPWPCHSPEQLTLLRRLEDISRARNVRQGRHRRGDRQRQGLHHQGRRPGGTLAPAQAGAGQRHLRSGTMKWSGHYLVDPWNSDGW